MPEPPAPPSTATYRYLLHISCAAADEGFVERALLPGLGLLPGQSITRQDFTPGLPQAQEFERAVTQSRYTLLLISPAWRQDPWTRYVEQVATLASLGQGRLLCLLRAAVPLSLDLQSRVNLDGSDADLLETALRRLRELLALPPPAPTPIPCPYPGMRPFSEGDAASFFGRERELEDLLLKLRSQRRVYLIGPSGSGKTSLLYAGLLPALQRPASPDDALLARVLRPGEQPLTALRRALREPQAGPDADDAAGLDDLLAALPADAPRLLLVLDQFEEVFTRAAAPARAAFFAGLDRLTREPRCAVLIVLRADFYPELMSSALWPEDGGEALAAARLELAPLRGERLREAIRRPAEQSGVFLEEGLLERLMADAAQEPGVLPLMQETLALLWERRKGRLLTVAAYQALGRDERSGLAVAVASKADGALAALADAGERAVARRVLLRLCHFGAGRSYTRRQQREDELQVAGEAPGAAQAERFQRVLQHLIDQRLLTVSGEPGGVRHVDLSHEVLLRGWPQLARWIDERRALEETRRRLEDKAEEWQRLEQRGGLLDAIEVAEAEAWLSGEAAQALGSSERLRALVTADAGRGRVKIWDVHSGEVVHLLAGHDEFVYFSAFSPDGTVVITTDKVGKVKLWDAQRGALLFTLEGHKDTVRCAAFSPDGQRVMTASFDGTAQVWDVQRGVAALVLIGHEGTVSSAAFSADGSRLLTAGSDGTARLWDARSGQPLCTCMGHQGAIRARFSPNGERLVSAGVDGSARLWTARGGPQRLALQAASIAGSVEARFSADGSQVFTIPAGLGGMPLQLWHAQSGQLLRTLEGGSTAALSPDGSCVVSCISFKADPPLSPRLLALQSGQLLATLVGHAGQVDAVDFSADSARVLSISTDRTARLWDARTGQIQVVLRGHASALVTAVFSPDGARVVTASEDGTAKLWDVGSGALLLTLADHAGPVSTVCFSPQGERVLTGDAEGKVRLWDVPSGQLLLAVSTHRRYLRTACFSRDGARVLTVGDGGPSPKLWDASSGRLLAELEGHRQGVRFATFSPNGLLISSADVDNVAMLWDGHSGRLLWELPGSTHQLSTSAFSPDGAVLVTGGTDGVARLWDLPLETRAPAAITALTRLRAPYVLDEEGRLTPVRKATVT